MKKFIGVILLLCMTVSVLGCSSSKGKQTECSHINKSFTCTEPEKCNDCGEVLGTTVVGHSYTGGVCIVCGEKDPTYYKWDELFSGTPELLFKKNPLGKIDFRWTHDYIGEKTINYLTLTFELYDRVGNPIGDDINNNTTCTYKLIGPVEPGRINYSTFYSSNYLCYSSGCNKIRIKKLLLEFDDGTIANVDYGWESTVGYSSDY